MLLLVGSSYLFPKIHLGELFLVQRRLRLMKCVGFLPIFILCPKHSIYLCVKIQILLRCAVRQMSFNTIAKATPNGSNTPSQTGTPNTDAAGAKDVKVAMDLLKGSSKGEDEVPNVPKDVNEDISAKTKVDHHRVDANGDKNKDKEREKERSKRPGIEVATIVILLRVRRTGTDIILMHDAKELALYHLELPANSNAFVLLTFHYTEVNVASWNFQFFLLDISHCYTFEIIMFT